MRPQITIPATLNTMESSFRLARKSPLILGLTLILFALPFVFFANAVFGNRLLAMPALLVLAACSWVWLRFRPTLFVVRPGMLEVIWPLKRRKIPKVNISYVRLIDKRELRLETGWCMRVEAGGLGVDSDGCGRSAGGSYRCTYRAPTVSYGLNSPTVGRG